MTEKEQALFYIGAAIYLDLESDEVDRILASVDLTVEATSLAECVKAIRKYRVAPTLAAHLEREAEKPRRLA